MTPTPIVVTDSGPVQGFVEGEVQSFLGIPYGAPTGGSARFRAPSRPQQWQETRAATAFGPRCPQAPLALPDSLKSVLTFADLPESEDCLSLNVWTRALDGGGRPVLVWIHGGGFATGTGAEPDYHGANLARRQDVVVVTLNHRLNAFGFLYLGELPDASDDAPADVGLLDIVLALGWVRDNIARFGGDAGNVTLFGQSGGG